MATFARDSSKPAPDRAAISAITRSPSPSALIEHFGIDPSRCFLNHGSFGATPIVAIEEQARLRRQMEAEPIRYFVEELEPLMDVARLRMAAFVGCPADDFAFVQNATAGVNTVATSLRLSPGDEILSSNHEYNACNNALRVVAERAGAKLLTPSLHFPVKSADEVASAICGGMNERTRLVMISHITSPTGVIFPIEQVLREAKKRGIDVLIDGAHAPGFLPVNVAALAAMGCTYYTGNFHKWACAPKGSAFLYVNPARQAHVHPLIVSHGLNATRTDRSRFRLEFDYIGSLDYSPFLASPTAIDAVAALVPGGWQEIMRRNRALVLAARDLLCERLGTPPGAPDHMLGAMAAVPIAPRTSQEQQQPTKYHDPLQDRLIAKFGIQVPIIPFPAPPVRYVRLSAHLYNTLEQFAYLADALVVETKPD